MNGSQQFPRDFSLADDAYADAAESIVRPA